jgi:hypothetical protein
MYILNSIRNSQPVKSPCSRINRYWKRADSTCRPHVALARELTGSRRGNCAHVDCSQRRAPSDEPSRHRKSSIVAEYLAAANLRDCGNVCAVSEQRSGTPRYSPGHDCRPPPWSGTRRQPCDRTVCIRQKLPACHQSGSSHACIAQRDWLRRHGTHRINPAGNSCGRVVRSCGNSPVALYRVRPRSHFGGAHGTVAPIGTSSLPQNTYQLA